jgi:transcriptional regulator with XRE-family HTH domain
MTNKDKFLSLVNGEQSDITSLVKERIRNRAMLRESQAIALKVLMKLDELKWSQRKLANEMGVSPQQISKIVSGNENLTLDTQVRLQQILDIPILASYHEVKAEEIANVMGEMVRTTIPYKKSGIVIVTYDVSQKIGEVKNISQKSYTDIVSSNG